MRWNKDQFPSMGRERKATAGEKFWDFMVKLSKRGYWYTDI